MGRAWNKRNLDIVRASYRKHNYKRKHGITLERAKSMLDNQDGKCAICSASIEMYGQQGAHLDHDHKSGKIRGVLCPDCNLMLGHAKDSINTLLNAADYLKEFREKQLIAAKSLENIKPTTWWKDLIDKRNAS